MRAAWYERQGAAREVLIVGEMRDPEPGAGEMRIRVAVSGVNPGDVKKRDDAFSYGMSFPRVIPHSDGAGVVDRVGSGLGDEWIGRRVWCYGAQSYRPFGTAAEYTVVPAALVVALPDHVPFAQGACLGIPGITAYAAVHAGGDVRDRVVLVQGGAGAVGVCAIQLARQAGAHVIATVRASSDAATATAAGAHDIAIADEHLVDRVRALAPNGVAHIIEVALGANVASDVDVLEAGGSIATYASNAPTPPIPFWPLVFKNVRLFFLGSDDFPGTVKIAATRALNDALDAGWSGFEIAESLPLSDIAIAHERVEHPARRGRIVVAI
jgi:NADPH2:quinone reductase